MGKTKGKIMSIKTKYVRDIAEAVLMKITPAIAKEMLETSPGNRTLRDWYVDLLAGAMQRGEWRITSQGIGFDSEGRLRDAHHRLNACIKSGKSFWSVVVFGLDTDAYEVTDIGIIRTYADRLGEGRDVADVMRLGCQYATGCTKPTISQMRPIIESGLQDATRALVEFCNTKRKFYSSAPMKLAACIEIMVGEDPDFVFKQYRALCTLNFDEMSQSAKSLVRQVESGKAKAGEARESLARGFRVFNKNKQGLTKIQISDEDKNQASDFVRKVLKSSLLDHQDKVQMFQGSETFKYSFL